MSARVRRRGHRWWDTERRGRVPMQTRCEAGIVAGPYDRTCERPFCKPCRALDKDRADRFLSIISGRAS